MPKAQKLASEEKVALKSEAVLSPFKAEQWLELSPGERLERAWALRARLVNPEAVHDSKLFPKP